MAEGYVMNLREKVGHIPMVIACASLITYDPEKGILLQRRKDNGCWTYHGGSIEPGETAEEAARRETFEEVGLTVTGLELYSVASGEEQHFFYPNGDEVYVIDAVFISKDFTGELKLEASEVLDAQWFAFDALPENLSPATKTPLLNFARKMNKNVR